MTKNLQLLTSWKYFKFKYNFSVSIDFHKKLFILTRLRILETQTDKHMSSSRVHPMKTYSHLFSRPRYVHMKTTPARRQNLQSTNHIIIRLSTRIFGAITPQQLDVPPKHVNMGVPYSSVDSLDGPHRAPYRHTGHPRFLSCQADPSRDSTWSKVCCCRLTDYCLGSCKRRVRFKTGEEERRYGRAQWCRAKVRLGRGERDPLSRIVRTDVVFFLGETRTAIPIAKTV